MSSEDLPDTLDVYMKPTKKFLGIFEKKFQLNYEQEKELKVSLESYSEKSSCFELKFFFSNVSRKFPINVMKTCKVSERSTQPRSLRQ